MRHLIRICAKGRQPFTQFRFVVPFVLNVGMQKPLRKSPETLDTACYTAIRNRKGHRSPDQHDRFQAWTVSSCSPNVVVIPRGWLLLAAAGSQPVQRRTHQ